MSSVYLFGCAVLEKCKRPARSKQEQNGRSTGAPHRRAHCSRMLQAALPNRHIQWTHDKNILSSSYQHLSACQGPCLRHEPAYGEIGRRHNTKTHKIKRNTNTKRDTMGSRDLVPASPSSTCLLLDVTSPPFCLYASEDPSTSLEMMLEAWHK